MEPPKADKAKLRTETGEEISFLYNPTSLTIKKVNKWNAKNKQGEDAPELVFDGGESGSFDLRDIVFDTTHTGEAVTVYTNKLLDLMKAQGADTDNNDDRPPSVQFHWGKIHSFDAVIKDLTITFTYFSQEGIPLRAKVSMTLSQLKREGAWSLQNPTSGTPRPHRTHQVQAGETLDRIAADYYGDATDWRRLASANGINDPLAIRPGQVISVPKLSE